MGDGNRFSNDPVLKGAGQIQMAAIRLYMDEYAREIFDLWFSGRAPDEVIFDNPKWAAYMQADAGLSGQIDEHLTRYAMKVRDDLLRGAPSTKLTVSNIPYQTTFHAEVGATFGGFKTGYAQLHGSNREAGDFQMRGLLGMAPADGGQLAVSYTGNELTFNDKVDPNFKYKADAVFANMGKNLAAATGGPPPKDYILRIRWREPGPWTYKIPAAASPSGAPAWVRQYQNIP